MSFSNILTTIQYQHEYLILTGLLPVSYVFRTLGLGEECTVIVHGDGKEPDEQPQEAQATMTIQSQRAYSYRSGALNFK